MGTMWRGLLAGAAGTMALNSITYLDMLVRGRPASRLPADTARQFTASLGTPLGSDDEADNRADALGALLGYAAGSSTAVLYAFGSPGLRTLPVWTRMALVALAAMLAGNVPSIVSGITDPRKWGAEGWIADIVPHIAYGVVTVGAYEASSPLRRSRRR